MSQIGVAIFGAMFATRLSENLTKIFTDAGANAAQAGEAMSTLDPQRLSDLPDPVRDSIVTAYADSLAPVFWYLIPFILAAFVLALFLKQIPLSDEAGMVARGEAITGEEADAAERAMRDGIVVTGPADDDAVTTATGSTPSQGGAPSQGGTPGTAPREG